MKTFYIGLVSAVSAGMAAYLSPSQPYWIAVTVPALVVLTIHYFTYVRKSLRELRRMEDTRYLMEGECPVCGMEDCIYPAADGVKCHDCGHVFVIDPEDGFVDRRAPTNP